MLFRTESSRGSASEEGFGSAVKARTRDFTREKNLTI